MPRAIWKGSISFGLVQIPVGLYSAEESDELSFTMLDKRDLSPIGYERVNKKSGKEVPWADIVKGYEYEPGEYVVLQKEDFTRAAPEATQTIDIVDFVEREQIDPMYFDKPYYLAPQKPGAKGYALLREALQKSGKVGIAKVVIRTKQRLAAVIPHDEVLVLEVLRYPHEIRKTSGLELPGTGKKAGADPREVDMALRLVEGMSGDFDPTKYRDEYYDALMEVIEEKAKTGQIEAIEAPALPKSPKGGARDLMSLLKKSLEEAPAKKAAPARRTKAAPVKRAAKTARRRKRAA
jgi:DNA end-binding protein Ku